LPSTIPLKLFHGFLEIHIKCPRRTLEWFARLSGVLFNLIYRVQKFILVLFGEARDKIFYLLSHFDFKLARLIFLWLFHIFIGSLTFIGHPVSLQDLHLRVNQFMCKTI
jgi:hypothetical protein